MRRREFLGLLFGSSVTLLGGALALECRNHDGVSLVSTAHPGSGDLVVDEDDDATISGFGPEQTYEFDPTDFSTETVEVVIHEVHGRPLFPFEDRGWIKRYG